MNNVTKKTSGKILLSAALVAAAAGIAGLGTFGSFTSSTSASAAVASGIVKVELGASPGAHRFSVAATGMVPGDSVQSALVLSNAGDQDFSTVSLTTTATTSSKLDTDATNGLQLSVDSCSTPWVEAGTAPAYTYTCTGATEVVLASRPIVGTNVALDNLSALTVAGKDNLRVTMSFPTAAGNSLQEQSSVVGFDITATQRTATAK